MREKHRYHYIEDGNGKLLGKNDSTCDDNVQGIKSWKQFVFFRCSNCLCYCDDKDNSDRRFSLREVVSSVQQNRFVRRYSSSLLLILLTQAVSLIYIEL